MVFMAILVIIGMAQANDIGVAAYWNMDEPEDSLMLADTSLSTFLNTVTALPGTLTTGVGGKFGNAIQKTSYSVSSNNVLAPDTGLPMGKGPLSISLWFNISQAELSAKMPQWFITYGLSTSGGMIGLEIGRSGNPANLRVVYYGYDFSPAVVPGGITYDQWHLLVYTMDFYGTGKGRLYLDNTLITEQTLNTSINIKSEGHVRIGSWLRTPHSVVDERKTEYFRGKLDDIAIWDRVLSEEEIEYLWDNGDGNPVSNLLPPRAFDPQPINYAPMVDPALTTNLTWSAPDIIGEPNILSVEGYDVYMYYVSEDHETEEDPNFLDITPVFVSSESYPVVLNHDSIYFWRVDTHVAINYGDGFDILKGVPWLFTTTPSIPTVTQDLVNVTAQPGSTVEFEVQFYSSSPQTLVSWYKDSVLVVEDERTTINTTSDTSTLTVTDYDPLDNGTYLCVIENESGSNSSEAILITAQLLAHYEFEENLLDSVGDKHGTAMDTIEYTDGIVGDYAADPNGYIYVELPQDAYPKAGYGNGLEQFTYSCWIRSDSDDSGSFLGAFNEGSSSGVEFRILSNGAVCAYLREDGGAALEITTATDLVWDNQWHLIAVTYDGATLRIYVDSVLRSSSSTLNLTNFSPWQHSVALLAQNFVGSIGRPFTGQVDDMQILNYAKSGEEIAKTYYDITGIRPCIYGNPTLDVNGPDGKPDCVVDLWDLMAIASQWLSDGLYIPN